MTTSIFEKREQAFEAVFFARLDQQMIEKLRAKRELETAVGVLEAATGIHDREVLKRVLSVGIDAHNLQALSLVPLVSTAWASGEVTPEQRTAALRAVHEQGIAEDSVAHHLFEAWLSKAPGPDLEAAWAAYVRELLEQLDDEAADALRTKLGERCRRVAEASGGFLGIHAISNAEEKTMARLDEALR